MNLPPDDSVVWPDEMAIVSVMKWIAEGSESFICRGLQSIGRADLSGQFELLFRPTDPPEWLDTLEMFRFGFFGRPYVADARGHQAAKKNQRAFDERVIALGLFLAMKQQENT